MHCGTPVLSRLRLILPPPVAMVTTIWAGTCDTCAADSDVFQCLTCWLHVSSSAVRWTVFYRSFSFSSTSVSTQTSSTKHESIQNQSDQSKWSRTTIWDKGELHSATKLITNPTGQDVSVTLVEGIICGHVTSSPSMLYSLFLIWTSPAPLCSEVVFHKQKE